MKSEPLGAGAEHKCFLRAGQLIVLCTGMGEILLRGPREGDGRKRGGECLKKEMMAKVGIKSGRGARTSGLPGHRLLCNTQGQFGLFFRDCKAGKRQKCCCIFSLPPPYLASIVP